MRNITRLLIVFAFAAVMQPKPGGPGGCKPGAVGAARAEAPIKSFRSP